MPAPLSPRAAEIVACARGLLATGGYHGFSYADIAQALGLSKPTLHHHFATKAELVRTVVRQYRVDTREGLAGLAQMGDPRLQLQAYTGYWAQCIRDATVPFCVCAMLAAELPAIPEEVAVEVRGHFEDVGGWLAKVLAEGAERRLFQLAATPDVEARSLLASVHGAMLAARAHGDPDLFATLIDRSVRHLDPSPTST